MLIKIAAPIAMVAASELWARGTFCDSHTDLLRKGARALLAQAIEAKVAGFLADHADRRSEDGGRRWCHRYLPERPVMTGIGPVAVRVPRVRDRLSGGDERIRFTTAFLPPMRTARRAWRC
jgi:hypothetical protein